MTITAERVRGLFAYSERTGLLTRLVAARVRARVGDIVGTPNGDGYLAVRIGGRKYLVHRIIWLWMTGEWPAPECDHEDTFKANNRWDNLRLATGSQNNANKDVRADNKSGSKASRDRHQETIALRSPSTARLFTY
jgi:hypothetical protein